jgi:hypothetical protein
MHVVIGVSNDLLNICDTINTSIYYCRKIIDDSITQKACVFILSATKT